MPHMTFEAILGQDSAVEQLRRALDSGHVPHAYRFEGPDGVGKERCAFALAEALVCGPETERADATCRTRVHTLCDEEPHVPLHPDVVLVGRGLYGKLLSAAEVSGIGIEQIRRIVLSRAGYPPHEGRSIVFLVRDAHELTTQAANALLKTLEEPAAHIYFVLLTSRPRRLLDTILSRTVPVRFGPLSDAIIGTILEAHGAPASVAPLAQGSAALALQLANDESLAAREQFVERTLGAIAAPSLAEAIGLSDSRTSDRHALREQLSHLAQTFASRAREAVLHDPALAEQAARRHAQVLATMREIEQSAQPALALEAMVARLRRL